MKKIIYSLILILITNIAFSQCDSTLWSHVYKKERFQIIEQCITLQGIVKKVIIETDGDYHIQLKLNPSDTQKYLNTKNYIGQDTNLVIEIICSKPPKQKNATEVCQYYTNNVKVPKKGSKIKVTGTFVKDLKHGWNEIHPVSKIE